MFRNIKPLLFEGSLTFARLTVGGKRDLTTRIPKWPIHKLVNATAAPTTTLSLTKEVVGFPREFLGFFDFMLGTGQKRLPLGQKHDIVLKLEQGNKQRHRQGVWSEKAGYKIPEREG